MDSTTSIIDSEVIQAPVRVQGGGLEWLLAKYLSTRYLVAS